MSSPDDLMLSDMTFTSRPAPWNCPPGYALTVSAHTHIHTCCLFGALCALVHHLLSLAIHRQHRGSATSTQVQPSMCWMHVKSYLQAQQCAQMTNTLKTHTLTHTHTDPSESSYMLLVQRCYLEALELPHPSLSTLDIVLVCRHPPFLTNVHSKCVCADGYCRTQTP